MKMKIRFYPVDENPILNSEPYDDNKRYYIPHPECSAEKKQLAAKIREQICEWVIDGKLDATDLKIIRARDCSPMPTLREVAEKLGISHQAVHARVDRFRSMFAGM